MVVVAVVVAVAVLNPKYGGVNNTNQYSQPRSMMGTAKIANTKTNAM